MSIKLYNYWLSSINRKNKISGANVNMAASFINKAKNIYRLAAIRWKKFLPNMKNAKEIIQKETIKESETSKVVLKIENGEKR